MKIPELCSFLAMLVLFFTLVTCRDYQHGNIINPENPNESMIEDNSVRGQICHNKNFLLSMSAMLLFSIFFGKFWKKYIEKKKKQAEIKRKQEMILMEKMKKNE